MSNPAFSFKPDTVKVARDGEHTIVRDNSYIALASATQGSIFYTPKDNKYWITEGKECPKDVFKERFLPYLRWKFDEIVEETVLKRNEKGDEIQVKTGRKTSSFPPTPENIAKVRQDLLENAVIEGKEIDQTEIYRQTSPTMLTNNDKFESMLDKAPADEKLARRLNSMSRF